LSHNLQILFIYASFHLVKQLDIKNQTWKEEIAEYNYHLAQNMITLRSTMIMPRALIFRLAHDSLKNNILANKLSFRNWNGS